MLFKRREGERERKAKLFRAGVGGGYTLKDWGEINRRANEIKGEREGDRWRAEEGERKMSISGRRRQGAGA